MAHPVSRYLSIRACEAAALAPDGRQLAFLYNLTGTAQIYRLDGPGLWPQPLTAFPEAVRQLAWSPAGDWLAVTSDAGGSERERIYLVTPDGSKTRLLTDDPEAIHAFGGWSPDGGAVAFAANRRNPAHFDLYVQEADAAEARRVLEAEGANQPVAWSPDGGALLFRHSRGGGEQELRLLDLATGEARPLTRQPARYEWPHFAPDGKSIYLVTDLERDHLGVARLDLATGDLEYLHAGEWEVEALDVSADGTLLAYSVNQDGYSRLVITAPGAAEPEFAWEVDSVVLGLGFSRAGDRLWFALDGPTAPADIWVLEVEARRMQVWTRAWKAGLPASCFAPEELRRYPSFDGLEIPVFLYRPADAAGPLPVVVYIHGGPESQERPAFNPFYQCLVNRGIAVAAPNIRGSTGYGKAYQHLDDVEKRPDALRDVEQLYHWLARSGWADPRRIALVGRSYGGFVVLACLSRFPELWAAGADIYGIANFETFFRHTGPWRRRLRAREYGDPETDAALLRELSPIHQVDRIRAPLLVIQGANDPRVPQEESDQVVAALRERGQPVEYLVFPDEGHGFTRLENKVRAYGAVVDFLERYLGEDDR